MDPKIVAITLAGGINGDPIYPAIWFQSKAMLLGIIPNPDEEPKT